MINSYYEGLEVDAVQKQRGNDIEKKQRIVDSQQKAKTKETKSKD